MDALDKFLELALDLFFDHGDHLEGKLIWISAVNSSPANHLLLSSPSMYKVKLDLGLDK